MDKWQTMETAPKDGTWVLLSGGKMDHYWDDGRVAPPVVCAQFREGRGEDPGCWQFAYYDGGYYGEYEAPTRWMPVPAP